MDIDEDTYRLLHASPLPDDDGLLTGTPVFDALFAALERTSFADVASLGLLLGASSTFG